MENNSRKKNETGINNKTKREILTALISPIFYREDAPENMACPSFNPKLGEFKMKSMLIVILICCLFVSNLEGKSEIAIQSNSLNSEQTAKTVQQQIQEHIKNDTIVSNQSIFLTEAIWSQIESIANKKNIRVVAEPNSYKNREQLIKQYIGPELYAKLETLLLNTIKSSSNNSEIKIASRLLGKGLSSSQGKSILEERLKNEASKLFNNGIDDYDQNLLFYLAESLCYSGDESGLIFIIRTLESEDSSSGIRCAAIRALTALSTTQAEVILLQNIDQLFQSDDASIILCALKCLSAFEDLYKQNLNQELCNQLQRFALHDDTSLNQEELQLLINITASLQEDIVNQKLSVDEKREIKKWVKSILHNKSTEVGEKIAVLFALLSEDEDKDTIEMMLESQSNQYRSLGTRCILTGSSGLKAYFLKEMITMLDDSDPRTRDYALTIVRRYKGEKAGTGLSKEDFEKERERIKKWWESNKDGV